MRPPCAAGKTRRWITGAGAVLFLVLLFPGTAPASELTLRVDGLACPFCAYGVEKKLLAVPGVAGIDVLINEGRIVLKLAEAANLDVAALDAAVEPDRSTTCRGDNMTVWTCTLPNPHV